MLTIPFLSCIIVSVGITYNNKSKGMHSMSSKKPSITENKAIGLKGKVSERFARVLKKAVDWAYRCDEGYVVVYGGFKDNKLTVDDIEVDYVVYEQDIEPYGHTTIPMYVISCKSSRLNGMCWGDVEEILKKEYNEVIITFGAMYQDVDIQSIINGKALGLKVTS
jgi:hypothetical protein